MEFETVCLKVRNLGRLYCYFKVKFRNHIEAIIRKQESQKCKFDRLLHEDIHGLIQSPSLGNDELLMLWGLLRNYRKKLINDRLENMKN
ncbi:transcriptional regulator [Streptococcus suis]|nr:transcriptional regulator [Streptococcus suis]